MKSVDCVHVTQQKDTASSPSAPPGAASGTAGLFSLTFLWLAMLLSSCLAAVSLYHVIALKTELEALRSKLIYRVQARSLLDQPPVSSDENKAGTPAPSFLRASAAGTGQVSRRRAGFWLAGDEQPQGRSHGLLLLPRRRTGCLALPQLKASRRKYGAGAETGEEGLLCTRNKQVNSTWWSGLGCRVWILSREKQQCLTGAFSRRRTCAPRGRYGFHNYCWMSGVNRRQVLLTVTILRKVPDIHAICQLDFER